MALLEIDSLRVGYGFPVLMGISFEVEEGETAVMFGLNGAGKTTTVSTIAGLLKPDGGSIRFDGKEIGGRSAASLVASGVALVPEGRRVFAGLSVANNLRLGAWTRRGKTKEIEERRSLVFDYFPRLAEREDQAAGRPPISSPSNRIDPPSGRSSPAMVLTVVVFPAPLRPNRTAVSPSSTSKLMPISTGNP